MSSVDEHLGMAQEHLINECYNMALFEIHMAREHFAGGNHRGERDTSATSRKGTANIDDRPMED